MSLVSNTEILNYLQAAAGITVPTAGQTLITMIQPLVEAEIKRVLGFEVEQATYTEFYPEGETAGWSDGEPLVVGYDIYSQQLMQRGYGQRSMATLRLRNVPVRSVTSIYENPGAWESAAGDFPVGTLLSATAYHLDLVESGLSRTGFIFRASGLWVNTPRCIKVTYVAGWTALEIASYFPEVKLAALVAMAYHYTKAVTRAKMGDAGGQIGGVSIEGFSVSLSQEATGGFAGQGSLPPESAAMLSRHINLSRYLSP